MISFMPVAFTFPEPSFLTPITDWADQGCSGQLYFPNRSAAVLNARGLVVTSVIDFMQVDFASGTQVWSAII